jgi:hypothetical protein
MDFITGALPNVMFIIGVMAIGIGLGIEFKIVEVKGDLGKGGRIGAFSVGAALIVVSVFLYLRPDSADVASVPTTSQSIAAAASTNQPTAAPNETAVPAVSTAVVAPSSVPTVVEVVAPSPVPTVVEVEVPDISGMSVEDATKRLASKGLLLGERKESCQAIGAKEGKGKKDKIICQSPAAKSSVSAGSTIIYVLSGDKS